MEKVITGRIAPDEVVEQGFEALLDPAGVDLHPGHLVCPGAGREPAERFDDAQLEWDHGRAVTRQSREEKRQMDTKRMDARVRLASSVTMSQGREERFTSAFAG